MKYIYSLLLGLFIFSSSYSQMVMYGIQGNQLITINPATGAGSVVGTFNASFLPVGDLAYDAVNDVLYTMGTITTNPTLLTVDRNTGALTLVGDIDETATNLIVAEGLAFDPNTNVLYATAGTSPSLSNRLVTVNPSTAVATLVTTISGTCNAELDGMGFIGSSLYGNDGCPNPQIFYSLNTTTGVASQIGPTQFSPAGVTDFTYDNASGTFYAVSATNLLLTVDLNPATPPYTTVGSTGLSGALTAVQFALPPAQVVPVSDHISMIVISLLVLSFGGLAVYRMKG